MPTRFDGWAPHYDDCALQPAFQAAHHAVLQTLTTAPSRVLDIGCGTGRLLRLISQRYPRATIVGLDPSAGMLTVAADGPGHFIRAAAEHLPFRDAAFDLVVSTASCRHWENTSEAFQEIARVLTPGGTLCAADVLDATSRRRRAPSLVARLVAAIGAAGLAPARAEVVAGFGPAPSITVLVARRPALEPEPHPRPELTPVGLATARAVSLAAPVRVAHLVL